LGARRGTITRALSQRRSLGHLSHRPWPVPDRPWVVAQSWDDLLFAHWPIDAGVARRLVPEALGLDLFEGQAWLGVVPFRMRTVRLAWCPPVPGTSSFPEVNVRTYVTDGKRRGVFFLSLDAPNAMAVGLGRRLWGLPYVRSEVSLATRGDSVSVRSEREPRPGVGAAAFTGRYWPTGPVHGSQPGTLEHWLSERYCFYSIGRDDSPRRTEVHHGPWPLQPAAAEVSRNSMVDAYGIDLTGSPLLHFSRAQDVVSWRPVTIAV